MITRDKAKACVAKFSGTRGYPQADEAKTALIDAFATCATEQHAERVRDDLLAESRYCPSPAEIYQVIRAVAPEKQPLDCQACDSTGWRPVVKNGVSAVERCDHRRVEA